jgi:hypothetical protein
MDTACTRAHPGSLGGKYLPRRLETKGQSEEFVDVLEPDVASRSATPSTGAETTILLQLHVSGSNFAGRGGHELGVALSIAAWLHDPLLSTLRGALHGENQFRCADIMPSAMMACRQERGVWPAAGFLHAAHEGGMLNTMAQSPRGWS